MITQWISHLNDPEDRVRFSQQIRNARPVLERLAQILETQEQGLDRIETGAEIYTKPGCDGFLAYTQGKKSAYRLIKEILKIDHKDPNDERPDPIRPHTGNQVL